MERGALASFAAAEPIAQEAALAGPRPVAARGREEGTYSGSSREGREPSQRKHIVRDAAFVLRNPIFCKLRKTQEFQERERTQETSRG